MQSLDVQFPSAHKHQNFHWSASLVRGTPCAALAALGCRCTRLQFERTGGQLLASWRHPSRRLQYRYEDPSILRNRN